MMNKLFTILFLYVSSTVLAQTVVIPDDNFRQCLIERHPSLLDDDHNLIISEAEAYDHEIICYGRNIRNVEGLQYFTNATTFNFSDNAVVTLPEFSHTTTYQVRHFKFDENELVSVPSVSNFTEMNTFDIRRNQLNRLPDFTENEQLEYIYAHTNNLDTLPGLGELPNLITLNVALNRLKYLPSLDSLKHLKKLIAWRNDLVEIPSLASNDSLIELDVSENNLTQFPELPENNHLEIIRIKNNHLTSIPDFSAFPLLDRVILEGNKLSFEDLLPLAQISDYETIFSLSNQQVIKAGYSSHILENQEVCFELNIDKDVPEVEYQWFFEGSVDTTLESDEFCATANAISDSGYYYCEITHPLFDNLVLRTDSFHVSVSPCLHVNHVSITITGQNCEKEGKVVINNHDQPQPVQQYRLYHEKSGEERISSTGEFYNVSYTEYDLYLMAGENEECVKKYPDKIEIPKEDCLNVHISPDGDGMNDSYYFDEEGRVAISDKFGNVVAEFQIPGKWEGMGQGRLVSPGLYYANINNGEKLIKITVVY